MDFVRPVIKHTREDLFKRKATDLLKAQIDHSGFLSCTSDDFISFNGISMPPKSLIEKIKVFLEPKITRRNHKTAAIRLCYSIITRLNYSDDFNPNNFKSFKNIGFGDWSGALFYSLRSKNLIVGIDGNDSEITKENLYLFERKSNSVIKEIYRILGLTEVNEMVIHIDLSENDFSVLNK